MGIYAQRRSNRLGSMSARTVQQANRVHGVHSLKYLKSSWLRDATWMAPPIGLGHRNGWSSTTMQVTMIPSVHPMFEIHMEPGNEHQVRPHWWPGGRRCPVVSGPLPGTVVPLCPTPEHSPRGPVVPPQKVRGIWT